MGGELVLDQSRKKLIRSAGAAELLDEIWTALFDVVHPSRASGTEHRALVLLVCDALEKFFTFFNCVQVISSFGAEDHVKAKFAGGGDHLSGLVLTVADSAGWVDLADAELRLVLGKTCHDIGSFAALAEGADWAEEGALAALDAGGLGKRNTTGGLESEVGSAV